MHGKALRGVRLQAHCARLLRLSRQQQSQDRDACTQKRAERAGPRACARSSLISAARAASTALSGSTFEANLALLCVYSWPQKTHALGGSSRSLDSDCRQPRARVRHRRRSTMLVWASQCLGGDSHGPHSRGPARPPEQHHCLTTLACLHVCTSLTRRRACERGVQGCAQQGQHRATWQQAHPPHLLRRALKKASAAQRKERIPCAGSHHHSRSRSARRRLPKQAW